MGEKIEILELTRLSEVDSDLMGLSRDDIEMCVALSKLDWSPKENWVDKAGGLPKFIEDIAVALIRDHGMNRSRAIATAISRVKRWAAGGGDVKADTQAKAAAALAQWEKMKASTKGKSGK